MLDWLRKFLMTLQASLSAAQKATLLTNINNNTATITVDGNSVQIKDSNPADGTAANLIADWYNGFPATDCFANHMLVPCSLIRGNIQWKKLTSKDSVPTVLQLDATVFLCRSNVIMERQQNVIALITPTQQVDGVNVADFSKKEIWQGLQDALTDVPSNTGGTTQDAGWSNVKPILCRKITNLEKVFADLSQGANFDGSTTGKAGFTVVEGSIDGPTVFALRQ